MRIVFLWRALCAGDFVCLPQVKVEGCGGGCAVLIPTDTQSPSVGFIQTKVVRPKESESGRDLLSTEKFPHWKISIMFFFRLLSASMLFGIIYAFCHSRTTKKSTFVCVSPRKWNCSGRTRIAVSWLLVSYFHLHKFLKFVFLSSTHDACVLYTWRKFNFSHFFALFFDSFLFNR